MQWVILSERLPKWWMLTGFIGCLLAALATDKTNFFIMTNLLSYNLLFYHEVFNDFMSGLLFAVPQSFLLKGSKGFFWLLVNGLGWASIPILFQIDTTLKSKTIYKSIILLHQPSWYSLRL